MSAKGKAVADPVHGTIQLTDLESQVISTGAFQRLRNVKQLGLAHMVFPGADYSRFSHSLGVCHVTGRILSALRERYPRKFTERDVELYRLAGLLHDVGHYPFSHATEFALRDHYAGTDLLRKTKKGTTAAKSGVAPGAKSRWVKHEDVGVMILDYDTELREVLRKGGFQPREVYDIFARKNPPKYSNLISSDLDADRIDFLLRTARHTGLPYGSIDLEYLLTQLCLDRDDLLCVHPKALRAVEHLLLGRYFDYQQVSYHKTVAGLELVLKDLIGVLLDTGLIQARERDLQKAMEDRRWARIDDSFGMALLARLAETTRSRTVKIKANCILKRQPPRLVVKAERFALKDEGNDQIFKRDLEDVSELRETWSKKIGIPISRWYRWEKDEIGLTKIGPLVRVDASHVKDGDKVGQLVRVLKGNGSSVPIFDIDGSMMNVLAKYALYSIRLYVAFDPSEARPIRQLQRLKEKGTLPPGFR